MSLRASDVVPISEARARLTELAEDVVGNGTEKLLTKNGSSYVALVDARKLDYYHALEAEHAGLVLVQGALEGLEDLAAGRVLDEADLDRALSGAPPGLARKPELPCRFRSMRAFRLRRLSCAAFDPFMSSCSNRTAPAPRGDMARCSFS